MNLADLVVGLAPNGRAEVVQPRPPPRSTVSHTLCRPDNLAYPQQTQAIQIHNWKLEET